MEPLAGTQQMRKSRDSRIKQEQMVDEEFEDLVERVLGREAREAELPMRKYIDSRSFGGVIVVTDSSDLGYGRSSPTSGESRDRLIRVARRALDDSFRDYPVDTSE